MPNNTSGSSYVSLMVNQRAKVSAIRQKIGLEPSSDKLKQLAPTNPNAPKMDTVSAGKAAMDAEDEFDVDGYEFPPEKNEAMLGALQSFIDKYYPEDGVSEVETEVPHAPLPPDASAKQVLDDERSKSGLAPMATFFRANKRLPTSEELKNLVAEKVIRVRLGREPTPEEIALYRESPAKEAANARK